MIRTYKEYSVSFKITGNFEILDFSFEDSEYRIYEGSGFLHTPGGHVFSHSSENVIRQLVTDFQLYDNITFPGLSSPVLYSFLKDVFHVEGDSFLLQWENHLDSDPFVIIKTTGKSASPLFGPDDSLFTFSFINITGLIRIVNSFAEKLLSENAMEEDILYPFPELLKMSYNRLSPDQKVAVQALNSEHNSGITLPLLLVLGEINPVEYVKGIISLKILPKEHYSENLAGVVGLEAYLGFILYKPRPEKSISDLIKKGEGDSIEFKSTLRWDIYAGKTNQAIERACLKTIAAFLNSNGGMLLIGVRDNGSIEGIETDKFVNEDKFLLHLWNLIRTCIGKDFSTYLHIRLEKMDEKTVCVVNCHPSNRPVFLHQSGFDEEMFIRVGPSSNALQIGEALKYIQDRFQKL